MEKNSKFDIKKLLIYFWIFVVLILLILFYCYFKFGKSSSTISSDIINVYSESVESGNWSETVVAKVLVEGVDVKSYSFDGGKNWQDSNEFIFTENGKFNIVVMDMDGNKSESFSYVVDTIDNTPPVITVKLPKEILLNEKINLKNYVVVSDDLSGLDGDVIINPSVLDTSVVGKKNITYMAKDKVGNVNSIYVSVDVVSKKNDVKEEQYVTMYRYRVKKTNTSNCKAYDCSYYNNNDTVEKIQKFVETGKCNNDYNKSITFRNGCYITPGLKDANCTQAFVTVDRYKLYDNYIIDIIALGKDGKQISNNTSSNQSKEDYGKTNDSTGGLTSKEIQLYDPYANYKASPCGVNEIEIYGYCHAICSKPEYGCPNGYKMDGGVCKKYVSRVCYDGCDKYTWSDWSDWSETEVIATDEIEVETKSVKK